MGSGWPQVWFVEIRRNPRKVGIERRGFCSPRLVTEFRRHCPRNRSTLGRWQAGDALVTLRTWILFPRPSSPGLRAKLLTGGRKGGCGGHQARGFYMQRNQPATTQDIRESGGEGNRVDWKEGGGRDVILSPLPRFFGTLDPQDRRGRRRRWGRPTKIGGCERRRGGRGAQARRNGIRRPAGAAVLAGRENRQASG
jgi:hypothetical protein